MGQIQGQVIIIIDSNCNEITSQCLWCAGCCHCPEPLWCLVVVLLSPFYRWGNSRLEVQVTCEMKFQFISLPVLMIHICDLAEM